MEAVGGREFRIPESIVFGCDCLKTLGHRVKSLGANKVLIVTDQTMCEFGYVKNALNYLEESGIDHVVYADVDTEPTTEHVDEGLSIYESKGCDSVVGLGGGSALDAAKGIALLHENRGSIQDYEGVDRIPKRAAPIIAIPTTAGTGSEATKIVVVTDLARQRKMMISSPNVLPRLALVDPLLTLTSPPKLTMSVGIDTLTHAIEAYVSIKAQPLTDIIAPEAVRLVASNLYQAWRDGHDVKARSGMSLAALLGGMAFSNSSVALVHGMSRPLGANFHIPHGLSNAVLLPYVMEFSYSGSLERYARVAEAMGEDIRGLSLEEAASRSVEGVKKLCRAVNVPKIRELGIDVKVFREMGSKLAREATASGSPANNPRKASEEDMVALYLEALG